MSEMEIAILKTKLAIYEQKRLEDAAEIKRLNDAMLDEAQRYNILMSHACWLYSQLNGPTSTAYIRWRQQLRDTGVESPSTSTAPDAQPKFGVYKGDKSSRTRPAPQ